MKRASLGHVAVPKWVVGMALYRVYRASREVRSRSIAPASQTRTAVTRRARPRCSALLGAGSLAGPLFVSTFSALGRGRLGYDPKRQMVSQLVRTDRGGVQTANFLACGGLMCAGALGVRRALQTGPGVLTLPVAIGAVGLGLVGAGVFATDTEDETKDSGLSRRGALHVAFAVPVFVGMPAACWSGARRLRREGSTSLAALSGVVGVVSLSATVLANGGAAAVNRLTARTGTLQRAAIASGLGWISGFCARSMVRQD